MPKGEHSFARHRLTGQDRQISQRSTLPSSVIRWGEVRQKQVAAIFPLTQPASVRLVAARHDGNTLTPTLSATQYSVAVENVSSCATVVAQTVSTTSLTIPSLQNGVTDIWNVCLPLAGRRAISGSGWVAFTQLALTV
jgi:hypothetical protein